jgi:LPXTG-motif cell wall-anchored protein
VRTWILPAAAVSFGTGILVVGDRVTGTGGLVLLFAGLAALMTAAYAGRRKRRESKHLLSAAGLLEPEDIPEVETR